MPIKMDTPDDDDNEDDDGIQALFLAVLAVSSWPSTTGNDNDNGNSNNVVWQNIPGGRHVRTLDETNFQQTIDENCCVLVFFHAKWCGYCGPVKPVFADVAARLQGGHPIVVAAVDCSDDDELAMTCNVNALPAMLFYQNGGQAGQAVEYQGDWSADNIRLFAVNNSAAAHKCTKIIQASRKVPGFELPRAHWVTLNRVRIEQWKCGYTLYKWGTSESPNCECREG